MKRFAVCLALGATLSAWSAQAGILFQSPGGYSHCCGSASIFAGDASSSGNPQWMAAHFSLSGPAHITGIGADFDYVNGTMFGAIIRVPGPTALPTGAPFDPGDVLVERTIDGGDPLYPVNAILPAGDFGLVFGTGMFGTHGNSGIWTSPILAAPGSLFFYGNQGNFPGPGPGWHDPPLFELVFTVTGDYIGVPEPSSWVLAIGGFALIGAAIRRRMAYGLAQ